MPKFSIVIPTHNRPALAILALTSAASQEDPDCEIIFSDNSTDAAAVIACREAADRLKDRRVNYVRPSEPLTMPDHWEFATRHATGDYLLILTDRFVMRPGTLEILRDLIEMEPAGPPEIVMWRGAAGFCADGFFFEPRYEGIARFRSSREVLEEFASSAQWGSTLVGSNCLPRGLNSVVRRDIIENVRKRYGRAYAPISPDYTSAFLQLVLARGLIELDLPMYIGHGEVSNGASLMRDGVGAYTSPLSVDPFEDCPLAIDTVMNTTIRDYLWVARTTGADLPPIDLVGYLLINYRELQLKRELGSQLDVAGMRRAVLTAAAALPAAERVEFATGQAIIDARETLLFRARNLLAKSGGLDLVKGIAVRLGLRRRPAGPRYSDALEAARAMPLRSSSLGQGGSSFAVENGVDRQRQSR